MDGQAIAGDSEFLQAGGAVGEEGVDNIGVEAGGDDGDARGLGDFGFDCSRGVAAHLIRRVRGEMLSRKRLDVGICDNIAGDDFAAFHPHARADADGIGVYGHRG